MDFKREHLILYAITDRHWLRGDTLAHQVELALQGGATMIQLREKELCAAELKREAVEIQAICRRYQVPFLINDNVALAQEIDADGVHVGQSDMEAGHVREILGPDKIIGVTAKTVEQAMRAEAAGADYLGSGAVFATGTKLDTSRLDHGILQKICESVRIPVVAIGGITAENLSELKGRKIAGAAVVSGIFAAEDIEAAARTLKEQILAVI